VLASLFAGGDYKPAGAQKRQQTAFSNRPSAFMASLIRINAATQSTAAWDAIKAIHPVQVTYTA